MKKNSILLMLSLLMTLTVSAQELTVKSMAVAAGDLTASTQRRLDINRQPCALVKVQLPLQGAVFEGNVIQPVDYKTNEYWVYMTDGSKELHVKHPNYQTLVVAFPDYGVKSLQSLYTYKIFIIVPQKTLNGVLINSEFEGLSVEQIKEFGYSYIYGVNGSDIDYVKALKFCRMAAELDDKEAAYYVGMIYYEGLGIAQDLQEAYKWYRKAAELGSVMSQTALGSMYLIGEGTDKNETKAFQWFSIAAEKGYSEAQLKLGILYKNGIGTKKDLKKAFEWIKRAAEQGNAEAKCELGYMYVNGKGTKHSLLDGIKWYNAAALQGYAEAQYTMGTFYELGFGMTIDRAQAKSWYQKAADQGHKHAMTRLKKLK